MLKSRVIDGPLFQMDDVARLRRAGWALTADAAPTADALASRQQLSSQLLPWLSVALSERGDKQSGSEAFNYAAQRWNTERKVGVRRPPREREAELTAMCEAAMRSGLVREAGRIARLVDHLQVHSLTKLSGCLAQQNDTTAIIELWDRSTADAGRRMLEDTACRVGMFNGARVLAWEYLGQFRNGPLAAIVAWLGGVSPGLPASPVHDRFDAGADYDVMRHDNRQLVRWWFLRSLATSLYAEGKFSWRPALRHSNHENVGDYLDHLTEFAGKVAEVLRSGGTVPFEATFEQFIDFQDRTFNSYFQKQGRSDFRSGLLLIAIDCHLLSALIGAPRVVTETSWQRARDTEWLNESSFPELVIEQGMQLFAPEIIDTVLTQRATDAVSIAQETCNVAQELQQLCELALFRGDPARARSLLRQAWDITIGYVHRKDPTLDEVMTALDYLSEAEPAATLTVLKSIGSQVIYLPEFTDGKGTRHVPGEASKLLAKLSRPALAQLHDEQVRVGDWSNAEISREEVLESSSAAASPFTQVLSRINQAAKIPAEAAWVDDDARAAPPTIDAKPPAAPPAAASLGEGVAGGDRFEVTAFGPNEFSRLLEEHERRRQYSGEPLVEWFNFWRAKSKTSTLLRSVVPVVLKMRERALGFNRLLNLVFEACVEQDGASERTFEVAVKVQIDNGGWLHYFEDTQASEARLRKVAELLPAHADEFIAKSTVNWAISEHMPSELLVPSSKLVFFLARLNRNAEAADLAKHMADSLIADTSGLVLPTPTWAR